MCFICERDFVEPVQLTTCSHVFCEKCALNFGRKTCPRCGTPSEGLFKDASKELKRLEAQQTDKLEKEEKTLHDLSKAR